MAIAATAACCAQPIPDPVSMHTAGYRWPSMVSTPPRRPEQAVVRPVRVERRGSGLDQLIMIYVDRRHRGS